MPDMTTNMSLWNSSSRFRIIDDFERKFSEIEESVTFTVSNCVFGRAFNTRRAFDGLLLHKSNDCALNSPQRLIYTMITEQRQRNRFNVFTRCLRVCPWVYLEINLFTLLRWPHQFFKSDGPSDRLCAIVWGGMTDIEVRVHLINNPWDIFRSPLRDYLFEQIVWLKSGASDRERHASFGKCRGTVQSDGQSTCAIATQLEAHFIIFIWCGSQTRTRNCSSSWCRVYFKYTVLWIGHECKRIPTRIAGPSSSGWHR